MGVCLVIFDHHPDNGIRFNSFEDVKGLFRLSIVLINPTEEYGDGRDDHIRPMRCVSFLDDCGPSVASPAKLSPCALANGIELVLKSGVIRGELAMARQTRNFSNFFVEQYVSNIESILKDLICE